MVDASTRDARPSANPVKGPKKVSFGKKAARWARELEMLQSGKRRQMLFFVLIAYRRRPATMCQPLCRILFKEPVS
jgi:hypothetical protein